ncbi:MAG: prolyl oligopeptidase family serine peptidase [bacterium]
MLRMLLVLTLTLLAPQLAPADDACLDGASGLADRRALTALRTATDSDCPCDGFTDGRGRAHYQRCARQVIKAALEADMLRRACLGTARGVVRGAICGTNRIACGGVDDSERVSCRGAAPSGRNACGVSPRRTEQACPAQAFCSDVVTWTAGTCTDPRHAGPYGAGVRVVHLVKDSVVNPGTDRILDTVVWYPTAPSGAPLDPAYKAVLDAPLLGDGAPYPLLLFSHGSCGYPAQSTFLLPLLASYGFVIAAPPHPGNTISEFPACGQPAAQGASANERPADVRFVLDQMLAANQDAGSPFFGSIDPDRVGMSGHSFGGFTTYVAVGQDRRFKIAIAMAPFTLVGQRLTVPSLTMVGQIDGVVSVPNVHTAYGSSSAPKLLVEIEDAGHYAFSDACFPGPDCNPPTTLTQDEAHVLVQRYVLPFLQRYLIGDASSESFFGTPPPGVVLSQQR